MTRCKTKAGLIDTRYALQHNIRNDYRNMSIVQTSIHKDILQGNMNE